MVHGVGGPQAPKGQGNDIPDYYDACAYYDQALSNVASKGSQKATIADLENAIDSLTAACGGNPGGACGQWIQDATEVKSNATNMTGAELSQQLKDLGTPPNPWGPGI